MKVTPTPREKDCGCFWNGGHWVRLCNKHLEILKEDLIKFHDIEIKKNETQKEHARGEAMLYKKDK